MCVQINLSKIRPLGQMPYLIHCTREGGEPERRERERVKGYIVTGLTHYFQFGGRTLFVLYHLARRWIRDSTRISLNLLSRSCQLQNEEQSTAKHVAVYTVHYLSVLLQVFADGHTFLDHMIQILGDGRRKAWE